MMDRIMDVITDLLDDHNIILYALVILAIAYPEQQGTIVGAIAGFWTGKVAK